VTCHAAPTHGGVMRVIPSGVATTASVKNPEIEQKAENRFAVHPRRSSAAARRCAAFCRYAALRLMRASSGAAARTRRPCPREDRMTRKGGQQLVRPRPTGESTHVVDPTDKAPPANSAAQPFARPPECRRREKRHVGENGSATNKRYSTPRVKN